MEMKPPRMPQGGPYLNSILPVFFDHRRHKLWVDDLEADLDVLAFDGQEHLSQPFSYHIEFTSTEQDLAAEQLLGKAARFSLYAANQPPVIKGLPTPEIKPLRTLYGCLLYTSDAADE